MGYRADPGHRLLVDPAQHRYFTTRVVFDPVLRTSAPCPIHAAEGATSVEMMRVDADDAVFEASATRHMRWVAA